MELGVNVPNFGPGTDPGVLREWAQVVEGLGFGALMTSDHVAVTPDVAERYPEPFYEPFATLAWLAGVTTRVRLGTTVLIMPYRHPLLTARSAATLDRLSGGRLVLGVGVGWARQEFAALGVPFAARGRLTDEYLETVQAAWKDQAVSIPVWIGGHSPAAIRRAARFGAAWHPLHLTVAKMRAALRDAEREDSGPPPAFAPRIALRLTDAPETGTDRLAGVGTLEQVLGDLRDLEALGAGTVVLDPYHGDPEETRAPAASWRALTAVATHWRTAS